ncbi:LOW QUALITY PROTEIN: hypothetical protein PoB_000073900 [Plakobranchus ocellatus]|uniref:Uncharacterized protein n=1 Tax=Plakobranchus ocellatus TaxID=259542 RepID=A0AAV3XT74_9GAST|nr:LOW QUALITY PROTEIN: hypothetical protein PoB_000073900 [Plakobranchus ocellatus]
MLKKGEEKVFERLVISQGSELIRYANQRLRNLKYVDCLVYRKVTFRNYAEITSNCECPRYVNTQRVLLLMFLEERALVFYVPDGESTDVNVPVGETAVVTLNFRTKGRPKGQDHFSRFAKKRKLASNTVVGESCVVDSCDLCGVCGDIDIAME